MHKLELHFWIQFDPAFVSRFLLKENNARWIQVFSYVCIITNIFIMASTHSDECSDGQGHAAKTKFLKRYLA